LLKKLLFDWPVRKLNHITVISEATKQELIDVTACPEEKIHLIEDPLKDKFLAGIRKPFNSECPNILQIGTSENKNLRGLIQALRGLKCRLTVIGPLSSPLQRELAAAEIDFESRSGLDDDEMRTEYENADIVTFCSTFEGFGLPIIEAQSMNTPVVTSDLSPMREVAGGGAILADPYDPASIREAIERLISDQNLRDSLVETGLKNIERFSSERIAEQYRDLYLSILESTDRAE
jgi:glycosyltransferase involved in cell wall biosynthesis